ncbi:MAG TPA: hypothetical protein PKA88_22100, partial [Polyangiaceae bacterium]|nr:hypothetical protein [Polyangiaceae bacterium]
MLAFAWSATASAQSIDGAVRLSLAATLLSYESLTLESKDAAVESVDATESSAGLLASSLGVGVGYAASQSLVLGAKVQQGTTTRTLDSDTLGTYKTSGLGLSPYVELVFSPESTLQPYLG